MTSPGGGCSSQCNCGQRLQRYLSRHELGVCSLLAGTSFVVFMALLPLVIDPSILTFVLNLEPASCLTVYSAALIGTTNCTWTSCQEGCTVDIFRCWHVNVSYLLQSNAAHPSMAHLLPYNQVQARLYPNVLGCGYPPDVDCAHFYRTYADRYHETFPCYVSLSDPTVAVIYANWYQAGVNLCIGLSPLVICLLLGVYISLRMRCQRRQRLRLARSKDGSDALIDTDSDNQKHFLDRRKQSWLNAFRHDRISASSSSSSSSSPSCTTSSAASSPGGTRIQLHQNASPFAPPSSPPPSSASPPASPPPSNVTSVTAAVPLSPQLLVNRAAAAT